MSSAAPPTEASSPGDEVALVSSLQAGDASAFETVIRLYGGRLLVVARQILGSEDDAHDALQDGFITAFKAIRQFEGKSKLSTWLHRVVVNAALMRLRSKKRKREQSLDDLLPTFKEDGHQARPTPEWNQSALAGIQRTETQGLVRACIDRLPDDYRTVLLLRDIQELDTAEVGQHLGITEGNVKVRLHRARQALKTLLEPVFGNAER